MHPAKVSIQIRNVIRSAVSKHSKDNTSHFTGNMANNVHIGFSLRPLFLEKGFQCRIVESGNNRGLPKGPSQIWGASLRHMIANAGELTGVPYRWVNTGESS